MKKIYGLMMAGALASTLGMTACSDDSSTSAPSSASAGKNFTVSSCKDHDASTFTEAYYGDVFPVNKAISRVATLQELPTATLVTNADGTYKIEIVDITENCGFNAKDCDVTTSMNGEQLVINTNFSGDETNCICNFDMSFDITAEQSKAATLLLNNREFKIVSKKN